MFKTNSKIYTRTRVQDEAGNHMFRAYEQYTVFEDEELGNVVLGDNGILYPIEVVCYMFNYVQ